MQQSPEEVAKAYIDSYGYVDGLAHAKFMRGFYTTHGDKENVEYMDMVIEAIEQAKEVQQ